jgi:PAS domain S-box-containing protein
MAKKVEKNAREHILDGSTAMVQVIQEKLDSITKSLNQSQKKGDRPDDGGGRGEMGKKILVVDNHPVMLKLMTGLLEKEGHQVLTAEDGLSTLDILKTFTPDVIFMDLIMPGISGEKLCKMIRRRPDLKDLYLVVLSAIAAETEINFSDLGADAYIAKGPFSKMAEDIVSVIHQSDQKNHLSQPTEVIGLKNVNPRQITKELLSIKEYFEVTLNSMSEGIFEITPEGRIVYANPTAVLLTGRTEEELISSNLIELFHEPDRQKIRNLLVLAENQPQFIDEDSPVGFNGKKVSLSISPVMHQEYRRLILILNDVSERKQLEAQLFQAQKLEAIGTLAGGIAHDFNNLLMVIQGNTSLMLLNTYSGDPHYERLRSIEKQIQNGSRLTSQLLGYASKGKYEVKPFNLNPLVEETSEIFGRTRKEISIHRELAPDLFPIEADQGQIEQVLMNLYINAADAMPRGGTLILKTVNLVNEDIKGRLYEPKGDKYVLLFVTDTGIGMDKKTLERIFDPFFTTKELGRGSGLGLASAYGIVKGHGGFIDVESKRGKGTTFKVYLPASEKKVQEKIKPKDQIIKGTETIFLIDDEEMILETGKKLLEALGYQVWIASDGRKAIEIFQERRESIDLVILDMVMPNMGGGEVFDRMKEISSGVKVLLSSGYSLNGEATKILERGCNGFIQKPFDMKQLSQSIRMILNQKGEVHH